METENNKLIAEFIGFDILSNGYFNYEGEIKNSLPAFDSDWNWLMEVVEKIESLDFNFNITSGDATALKNHGAIYQTLIYKIDGTKKIDAVYNTCVEFIKWHNKQK